MLSHYLLPKMQKLFKSNWLHCLVCLTKPFKVPSEHFSEFIVNIYHIIHRIGYNINIEINVVAKIECKIGYEQNYTMHTYSSSLREIGTIYLFLFIFLSKIFGSEFTCIFKLWSILFIGKEARKKELKKASRLIIFYFVFTYFLLYSRRRLKSCCFLLYFSYPE